MSLAQSYFDAAIAHTVDCIHSSWFHLHLWDHEGLSLIAGLSQICSRNFKNWPHLKLFHWSQTSKQSVTLMRMRTDGLIRVCGCTIDDIRADSAMIYAHAQLRVNGKLLWWTIWISSAELQHARKTSTP